MKYVAIAAGIMALLLVMVPGSQAAQEGGGDLLRYVPRETELVIGIDVEQLMGNPAFDRIYERLDTERLDAGIAALEQVTGIHLLHDIRSLMLIGELKDQGKGALYLEGMWDTDHLINLVTMNPTYERHVTAGPDIHSWMDESEGKMKYAAFLEQDVLVISDWLELVRRVVDTAAESRPSLEGAATPVQPDGSPSDAFVLAFRPSGNRPDITENPILGRFDSVAIALDAEDDWVTVSATGSVQDARDTSLLAQVVRGFLAAVELHDARAQQSPWMVTASATGTRVEATVEVPMDNVIEAAGMLRRHAKAE